MNDLALKEFAFEGDNFRIVDREGNPWFVAADIAAILDIQNVRQVIAEFPDDEIGVCKVYTNKGPRDAAIISEAGFYRLVFRSRKKEAERFTSKVVKEILPSIRKTGGYGNAQPGMVSGPKRPLLPDTKEVIEEEIALKGRLGNKMDDFVMLQFGKECFETTKSERDWVDIDKAYAAYLSYAANPLPIKEFAYGLPGIISGICLDFKGKRFHHCKFKQGVLVIS